MANSTKENVRVVIRAKPTAPSSSFSGNDGGEYVDSAAAASSSSLGAFKLDTEKGSVYRHGATVAGANELRHDFDAVFDDSAPTLSTLTAPAKQNVFFEQHVRPLIDRAIAQGLNMTILAFGETGSGKTYVMDGEERRFINKPTETAAATGDQDTATANADEESVEGIVSLAMRRCVSQVEPQQQQQSNQQQQQSKPSSAPAAASSSSSNVVWMRLAVKFVEIYNEKLVDLLAAAVAPRRSEDGEKLLRLRLRRREDGEDVFFVENLLCFECDSVADALRWYHRGAQQKTFRAHKMNAHSSRSHCIFTMIVTMCVRGEDGISLNRRSFEMNFVDLAGSERPDRIAVEESAVNMRQRAKAQQQAQALFSESLHINGSLSTLGRVIACLAKGSAHAPYRESKLTSLLRHTLGSNGLLLFVACVSVNNVPETTRTLVFASQARTIRVVAQPVLDANTVLIQQLRARIKELESDLSAALALNQQQQQQQQQSQQQSQQQHQQQPFIRQNSSVRLASESEMELVNESSELPSPVVNNANAAGNREALLSQSLYVACTKVQDLLRSNSALRSQMDRMRRDQDTVQERLSELERENLNLREKLEIVNSVVTLEARSTQEDLLRAAINGNLAVAPRSSSNHHHTGGVRHSSSSAAATPKKSQANGGKSKKTTTTSATSSPQTALSDNNNGSNTARRLTSGGSNGNSGAATPMAAFGNDSAPTATTATTAYTVTTRQQRNDALPPLSNNNNNSSAVKNNNAPSSSVFAPYMVSSARNTNSNHRQQQANTTLHTARAADPQNVIGLPLSLFGGGQQQQQS